MARAPLVILHHPQDSVFVPSFAADLRNAGFPVQIVPLSVRSVQDFRVQALPSATLSPAAWIAVCSPALMRHPAMHSVLKDAREQGTPVLGAVIQDMPNGEQALSPWAGIPLFDFGLWSVPQTYRERMRRFVQALVALHLVPLQPPDAHQRYLNRLMASLSRILVRDAEATFAPSLETSSGNTEPPLVVESLEAALAQWGQLLLVGERGSGKTHMAAQYLMKTAAHFQAAWETAGLYSVDAPLPIYFPLSLWPQGASIEDTLRARFPLADDPVELLHGGDAVLVLDGVQDVGTGETRRQRLEQLQDWLQGAHAPRRVLITARPSSIDARAALELPEVRIRWLNGEQVRGFVEGHLNATAAQSLLSVLVAPDGAANGARVCEPLIRCVGTLAQLVELHQHLPFSAAEALPATRGELERRWLNWRWVESWQGQRPVLCSRVLLQARLHALAVAALQNGRASWSRAEVLRALAVEMPHIKADMPFIPARALHTALALGFLNADEQGDVVTFSEGMVERLAALPVATSGPDEDPFVPGLAQTHTEVLRLHLQMLAERDGSFSRIAEVNPYLALYLWSPALAISPSVMVQVFARAARLNDLMALLWQTRNRPLHTYTLLAQGVAMEAFTQFMRQATGQANTRVGRLFRKDSRLQDMPPAANRERLSIQPDMLAAQLAEDASAALPSLFAAMQSPDWEVRRDAAQALGQWGDSMALPLLADMLQDADVPVRVEAVRALWTLDDPRSTNALVRAIIDPDPAVQRLAAQALCSRPDAIPGLITLAMHDHQASVRTYAAMTLGEMGDLAAYAALYDATFDPDPAARSAAVEALGKLQNPDAIERLQVCLHDYAVSHHAEGRICDIARAALLNIGTTDAVHAVNDVIRVRTDELPVVRPDMLSDMGTLLNDDVAEYAAVSQQTEGEADVVLVRQGVTVDPVEGVWTVRDYNLLYLDQADDETETRILTSVGEGADPHEGQTPPTYAVTSGEDAFAPHENDQNLLDSITEYVREELGEVAEDVLSDLQALEQVVSDGADAARTAVEQIAHEVEDWILPYLDDELPREVAWDAANDSGYGSENSDDDLLPYAYKTVVNQALNTVDDGSSLASETETEEVVNTSGEVPATDVNDEPADESLPAPSVQWERYAPLLNALREAKGDVPRARAAAKLIRKASEDCYARRSAGAAFHPDPQLTHQLVTAMRDSHWQVRAVACEVLSFMPDRAAVPALLRLLEDAEAEVRTMALRAMAEMPDARVLRAIAHCAADPDVSVRRACVDALAKFGENVPLVAFAPLVVDRDETVRRAALDVLAAIPNPKIAPAFIRALQDPVISIRFQAVDALAKLRAERSVPALIALLNSDPTIAHAKRSLPEAAAHALRAIGTDESHAAADLWFAQQAAYRVSR